MKSITLQLPDDLREQLCRYSQRKDQPIEDVACEIIRRRLATERFEELCAQSQDIAQAAGYTCEDQLLDDVS